MMNIPQQFFPKLNDWQLSKYSHMEVVYREWNERINVISRKDIDQFVIHHLLHSLAIAKAISFAPGTTILDAGSGGGFPGIPLAIMFPQTQFVLVDSIGKKIKVIEAVKSEFALENVTTRNVRFETIHETFDFITGRAVVNLPLFCSMVKKNVKKHGMNSIANGIFYLTGGETDHTLSLIKAKSKTWNLADFFPDPYFTTKKLIHLSDFQ